MTFQFRSRKPPVDKDNLYGEFARDMAGCQKLRDDIRHRAAYMYITGNYPSHLQERANAILTQISRPYRRPTSFDGRHGHRLILDDAIRDLRLNQHDMVKTVQDKVSQGYRIELDRKGSNRKGFSKIFMFKWDPYPTHREEITVTVEGAIKDGWN